MCASHLIIADQQIAVIRRPNAAIPSDIYQIPVPIFHFYTVPHVIRFRDLRGTSAGYQNTRNAIQQGSGNRMIFAVIDITICNIPGKIVMDGRYFLGTAVFRS